jgi:serine/threonine protein phosphatase PrpC
MSNTANQTAAKGTLPIVVGAESEVGLREENQDHMTGFRCEFGAVYVIADGMGGHRGGAEASRMVIEGLRSHLQSPAAGLSLHEAVDQAARLTNGEVFEKSRSGDANYAGMGSTLSLIVLTEAESGMELVTAHVGDSRVYLQRDGHLAQLTKDHTYVQRLVDSKAIDEEAARTHPDASVLTRAMGQTPEVAVDISEPIPLQDGDGILLCSDGLSGYVGPAQIEETLRRNPGPADGAKALVDLALKSGSDDNITVQFVRLGNGPVAVPPPAAKRRTQPEAEALPPVEAADAPQRNMSPLLLWAGVGLALLALAAGLYLLRHRLFPVREPAADPAAELRNHAARLSERAGQLHGRAFDVHERAKGIPAEASAAAAKSKKKGVKAPLTLAERAQQSMHDTDGAIASAKTINHLLGCPAGSKSADCKVGDKSLKDRVTELEVRLNTYEDDIQKEEDELKVSAGKADGQKASVPAR